MTDLSMKLQMLEEAPDFLTGYRQGFFPMALTENMDQTYWVAPLERCVLPIEQFHISRKLRKLLRQKQFVVKLNTDFDALIEACADDYYRIGTLGEGASWINDDIMKKFKQLHREGLAHSITVYNPDSDELAGGLYGLALGGVFFGESMVSIEDQASKIALCTLMALLHHHEFWLCDTQLYNHFTAQFGATTIPQEDFKRLLDMALTVQTNIIPLSSDVLMTILQDYMIYKQSN